MRRRFDIDILSLTILANELRLPRLRRCSHRLPHAQVLLVHLTFLLRAACALLFAFFVRRPGHFVFEAAAEGAFFGFTLIAGAGWEVGGR